jgi:hypothetical protein
MAKETMLEKYNALQIASRIRISALIMERGVESKHSSEKVLKIKDDQQFNLEGGRYAVEITPTLLIDNEGYQYSHDSLRIEEICEIVDNI